MNGSLDEIFSHFRNKTILVTGGVGSVGQSLVKVLMENAPAEVRVFDNNESELFFMGEEYRGRNLTPILGDIRDRDKLQRAFVGVDLVFHAAALKHVPLTEMNPLEAVQTNIVGTQNVIDAAVATSVQRVLYMSSDKAVNPTNVMGASKLMGERLFNAANLNSQGTVFISTRFGNVLGSRGSMIPLFADQIRRGGPITLTDPEMTRFIMTLDEAVRLVAESMVMGRGGEVFITKMRVARIKDVVEAMIAELAPRYGYQPEQIAVTEIGPRPGEKLYEELMNSEETRRSIEFERHFAVLPALKNLYNLAPTDYNGVTSRNVDRPYNSQNEEALSLAEVQSYLRQTVLTGEQ